MRRAALIAAGLTVVLVGGAVVYLDGVAPVATGYAARIGCSIIALQDRPVEDIRPELPTNPLVPLLSIEEVEGGVGAEVSLLGAWTSTAVTRGDGGCQQVEAGDHEAETTDAMFDGEAADDLRVPGDEASTDAAARDAGIDVAALHAVVDDAFVEDAAPTDDETTNVRGTRAVVVVHRGVVVAERYADGFDADTPLLGWSMTKSVADAMAGRLALAGALDVDAPTALDAWADDERAGITTQDLLTMTSGLAFEEVYDVGTDATQMLFTLRDAGAFAAAMPQQVAPGTRWEYSSGTTNILCDVLAARYDGPASTMAHDLVFGPLAMRSATMGTDASGDPVCSSYGYATARDWARFGLFYLQDGVWGGERLLPDGWVEASTTPITVPTFEDGQLLPYGRQWWMNADATGTRRYQDVPADAFWASGHEGQRVAVLPSHELVIVRLGLTVGYDNTDWGFERLVSGVIDATADATGDTTGDG